MTLILTNFTTYLLQVAIVVAVAGLLPIVFRLRDPKPRLIYWHLLLVTCLLLPVAQPWRRSPVVIASEVTATTGPATIADAPRDSRFNLSATEIVFSLLATGITLRLVWLCAGFWRMRRFRLAAEPLLPLPDEMRRTAMRLGLAADFYLSEDVTSPVTFGLRNPVVLLPAGFLELPLESREAVVCHELLHIQRNDWLFAIAEEFVRSILWFHPAVWWLLGRIQLTREEVVDQGVIEHTQSPDQYVDALIAIATNQVQSDLAPAPLFLKKRHLRQRVASIVRGVSMSKRSFWMSTLAVFSALPLVVGLAVWQFPLNAAPQEVSDGAGVDVKAGYYKVLHRTGVAYPLEAAGQSGQVIVSVSVDEKGEVTDAKVVSSQGPDAFRKAVLSSVLNWHFATEPWDVEGTKKPVPPSFEIAIMFDGSKNPERKPVERHVNGAPAPPVTVSRVDLSSLPAALQERVAAANIVREGDVMTVEKMSDVTRAIRAIDSHLMISGPLKDNTVALRMTLASAPTNVFRGMPARFDPQRETVGPAPNASAVAGQPPQAIRVGGNVQAMNLVTKVSPSYPPLAKEARIQGVVRFEASIDKTGHVTNLDLINGHPLLVPSAVEAVKLWVYKPTLLNGEPVNVITQIDVNYTLLQ